MFHIPSQSSQETEEAPGLSAGLVDVLTNRKRDSLLRLLRSGEHQVKPNY